MTPDPAARACWSTAAGLASRGLRCRALLSGRLLMEMPTTAGVIFLRTGASVGIPLACWTTGSGTLACAVTIPPVANASPNAAARYMRFIAPTLRGQKTNAVEHQTVLKKRKPKPRLISFPELLSANIEPTQSLQAYFHVPEGKYLSCNAQGFAA